MLENRISTNSEPTLTATAQDMTITPREIYSREMKQAFKHRFFGTWDITLAASGIPAGLLLNKVQTEAELLKAKGIAVHAGASPLLNLAQIPVDWKGIALAGVGFAGSSGLRRATRPLTIGRDIEKTIDSINDPDAIDFHPHTEKTYRKFKFNRRAREMGVTAAATIGGYAAGSKLGVNGAALVGTIGMGAAALKMQFETSRFKARGF